MLFWQALCYLLGENSCMPFKNCVIKHVRARDRDQDPRVLVYLVYFAFSEMFNNDTLNYWYRRTFTAYVAAIYHMTPYKTELEKERHIESYVEAYLGQFLMNTEENRQSSGKILKMVKQGFEKFIEVSFNQA